MKTTHVLAIASAAILLSSCGTASRYASSESGQRFQDGIYGTKADVPSRENIVNSKETADALVEKTKSSEIYLFLSLIHI